MGGWAGKMLCDALVGGLPLPLLSSDFFMFCFI